MVSYFLHETIGFLFPSWEATCGTLWQGLREDYSKDYNNPTRSEMGDVFRDLDELVVENMTMNREQKKRYEEIKKQIMNAFK